MRTSLHALLSVMVLCSASLGSPATKPAASSQPAAAKVSADPDPRLDPVSVGIRYKQHAIVISTKDGVAVVRFTEAVPRGTKYVYRFLPAGEAAKEVSGEGKLFEKERKRGQITNLAGQQTWIIAGNVKLEWSRADEESGWIYFAPELESVYLVSAEGSETLKLKRFAK